MINGESVIDQSGSSVSTAEDINGDGVDDVIIGAPSVRHNNSPVSRIVFFIIYLLLALQL